MHRCPRRFHGPVCHTDIALLAELNDLLQLDHDAVQAYTLALDHLTDDLYRSSIDAFRADHQRHVGDLTRLIRSRGGTPVELPHIPTGVFKLAVQGVGVAGGDRGILLAFKANERQVRDKYRRAVAAGHPADVREVLRRNADDEVAHYAWVLEALDDLGAGEQQRDRARGARGRAAARAHRQRHRGWRTRGDEARRAGEASGDGEADGAHGRDGGAGRRRRAPAHASGRSAD